MQARLHVARLALLRLLDHLVMGEADGTKLTKPQRRKLQSWVPQLAELLLEDGLEPEIEAIFDRHSDDSHAEVRKLEIANAEALFGEMLGDDAVKGHQAQSVDELMQHAAQNLASQVEARRHSDEAARQAADARAQQTAKDRQGNAASQRKDTAALQASQSVREIFRKLASALPPTANPTPPSAPAKPG